MPRLPFDPSKLSDPGSPAPGRNTTLSVREVAGLIKAALERGVASPLRVIGQIGNLSARGHWYFSLKDEEAVLGCVAWASSARRFGFMPGEGDEVIATGHVSHYAAQGRTQLYVTRLEPMGAGAAQLRFRALCEELRGLGYFEEARKQPLPVLPRRVAVITSADGAAIHDVRSTLAQRCPSVRLLLVNVPVQGEGAAEKVAGAIRWVDARRRRLGVDAIIVTRGGGSIEDLQAFNERIVADATFRCSLPLVAAIGHESDTTVIELVADRRAATPTQAVMALVPSDADLRRQIHHLADRLLALVRRGVERGRERLATLAGREAMGHPQALIDRAARGLGERERALRRVTAARVSRARARLERSAAVLAALPPHRLVARRAERLAVLADRLGRAAARGRERWRQRLAALERQLAAVDPRRVLDRGFSCTMNARGELVRSTGDVGAGETILTHVHDGSFESVVSPRLVRGGPAIAAPGRPRMDLFEPGQ